MHCHSPNVQKHSFINSSFCIFVALLPNISSRLTLVGCDSPNDLKYYFTNSPGFCEQHFYTWSQILYDSLGKSKQHFDACDQMFYRLLNDSDHAWIILLAAILLGTMVTIILLMGSVYRGKDNVKETPKFKSDPDNPELTIKLLKQLNHNNKNPGSVYKYNNFPYIHPGYLDLDLRIKLVSIVTNSILAPQYRAGSQLGALYEAGGNDYATVTPEMVGVVSSAELNPNWVYK